MAQSTYFVIEASKLGRDDQRWSGAEGVGGKGAKADEKLKQQSVYITLQFRA